MFRKVFGYVMALVMTMTVISTIIMASEEIKVVIDGMQVVFQDQQPVIVDGRTLVPVRGVFETMGFDVGWDNAARQARLTKADDVVVVTIDSSTFTTNSVKHTLDVPAQIIGGRTMLPLRAVLESVGDNLDWDGATSTVRITTGVTIENSTTDSVSADRILPLNTQESDGLYQEMDTIYTVTDDNVEIYEDTNFTLENENNQANNGNAPTASEFYEYERRVLELTNIERNSRGLNPLIWDDKLAKAARIHSEDMARNNFTGHIGSDGSTLTDRLQRVGATIPYNGENAYRSPKTSEQAVEGWMNSPGHRGNILNENYTHIGVGFYYLKDSEWGFHWTQVFGRDSGVMNKTSAINTQTAESFAQVTETDLQEAELAIRAFIDSRRQAKGESPVSHNHDELNSIVQQIANHKTVLNVSANQYEKNGVVEPGSPLETVLSGINYTHATGNSNVTSSISKWIEDANSPKITIVGVEDVKFNATHVGVGVTPINNGQDFRYLIVILFIEAE